MTFMNLYEFMEANKDFLTLFLISENVNNNRSPQYYGVTVIL